MTVYCVMIGSEGLPEYVTPELQSVTLDLEVARAEVDRIMPTLDGELRVYILEMPAMEAVKGLTWYHVEEIA